MNSLEMTAHHDPNPRATVFSEVLWGSLSRLSTKLQDLWMPTRWYTVLRHGRPWHALWVGDNSSTSISQHQLLCSLSFFLCPNKAPRRRVLTEEGVVQGAQLFKRLSFRVQSSSKIHTENCSKLRLRQYFIEVYCERLLKIVTRIN